MQSHPPPTSGGDNKHTAPWHSSRAAAGPDSPTTAPGGPHASPRSSSSQVTDLTARPRRGPLRFADEAGNTAAVPCRLIARTGSAGSSLGERPASSSRLWLAISLVLSLGLGSAAWGVWHAVPPPSPASGNPAATFNPYQKIATEIQQATPQVNAILTAFLEAPTIREKAQYIRSGATLLPRLEEYYRLQPLEPRMSGILPETLNWVAPDGRPILYGLLAYEDGSTRQFSVEVRPSGCLLDWQSLTGFAGTHWPTFLAEKPVHPVRLCASARPDTFHAGPFLDPARWLCLHLDDPSRQLSAWGFVDRQSPVFQALPTGLTTEPGRGPPFPSAQLLTLEARFPDKAFSSPAALLEITRVIHSGWYDQTLPSTESSRPIVK